MKQALPKTAIIGRVFHVAISALIVTFALIALCSLTACDGKTHAAQKSLEETLVALQNQNVAVAGDFLDAVYFDPTLFSVGMDTFVAAYFSEFTYEIKSSSVNSDGSATIEVSLTSKNMAEVLDDLRSATETAAISANGALTSQSADEAFIGIYSLHSWEIHENTFTILMAQDDEGVWNIVDKGAFGAILLDGYDPRQIMS